MAPPAPKRPSRPRPAIAAAPKAPPRRRPTEELPFDDGEVLNAARMQTEVRPVPKRPEQEAIPTTVYEISQDEELKPSYDAREVSDPGYKPAFLYVEKGPGQGQLLPVKQGSLVVGRASVGDLRLQHPSVSRRHAQITRLGERFYLKDLGSQNATYVNKVKIETEIEVYPGDQLQIGQAVLKLRGPAEKIPELAKKQIEKAAAKSARRKPVAEKAASSGPNKILLGLACAAIGFGLAAVLLFVVINLKNQQPTYQQLPAQQAAAEAAAQQAADDGPARVSPVAPVAPANVAPAQQQDPVAERIHHEMAKQPEAPAAEAEPDPEPVVEAEPVKVARAQSTAATIARREPRPAMAHKTERTPPRSEEDSEPATKQGADNAKVLKLYEDGDVAAAIAAAKASGDRDLASKLADFQSSYAAG